MQCPRCQAQNDQDAKFCEDCGARLEAVCPSCGQPVGTGKKFCRSCGASLSLTLAASSPQAYTPKHLAAKILTSKAALEGERKQVTVLFADLKGSMELLADRDPEEARAILDPVLERMMEAVHRYEGTVNQVMGDGIMALFGAPIAHEDHAVRACYAALRMQEAIKRYAAEVRRSDGVLVHIRIGVNSGEVVVRSIGSDLRMDYTAVGQTTHLAARMEQMAMPGSIVVSAETLRLAEGWVQVEPLGPVPVKGLAEPVEVYEVTGAGPVRTRLQASAARGLTRFVGRDRELETLRAALEQAQGGCGQLVAVVGEPGVGKSRLFHEFLRSHRTHEWLVLESASVSYGKATGYLPLLELLRAYFRIESRDDTRTMREKVAGKALMLDRALEDAIPAVLALFDVLPEESPFRSLEPPERRHQTLRAIKRLLLRESQVQPLLLVFEDLHWIDTETQVVLDSLVDSLPTAPVLLLVNYRPEYRHAWGSRTYYRQLRIDPLARENAQELLQALLGDDRGLQPLTRPLIERTEGNPFFLEECVRTLVETEVLSGARGAYRLTRALQTIQIPVTVQAILAARIDRLGGEDKQLLQTASVIGKDVPFSLLAAISDVADEGLRQALGHLQAAEFLYEASLFPELEYTFKHALTHEVAYGSLLGERRRAVHARIVAALERFQAERLDEHVERLAHHASQAEEWEKAVGYWQRAGERARLHSAYRAAAGCFEQALAANAHLPEGVPRERQAIAARLALRSVLIPLGEFEKIRDHMTLVEHAAAALDDERSRVVALAGLAECSRVIADHARAVEEITRADAIATRLGNVGLQAEVNFHLALTLRCQGRYRDAVERLRRNAALLEGDPSHDGFGMPSPRLSTSLSWLTWCLAQLGDFEEALRRGTAALTLAESASRARRVAVFPTAAIGMGLAHALRGEHTEAMRILEPALEVCRATELPFFLGWAAGELGWTSALAGDAARGVALLEEAVVHADTLNMMQEQALRVAWLGEAYLLANEVERARATVARALDLARRHGEHGDEAWALRLLGEVAARLDQNVDAAGHYERAMALSEELEMRPVTSHCHLGLGKLYRRTGKRQEAQEHLTTATTMYREMDMTYWLEKAEVEIGLLG